MGQQLLLFVILKDKNWKNNQFILELEPSNYISLNKNS